MKQFAIQYFAVFREQVGLDHESLESSAATPAELFAELKERYGFALKQSSVKVAINNEFAAWETPLKGGENIAFLPPMAGG